MIVPTKFHYCCYANMLHKEEIGDLKYGPRDKDFTLYQKGQLETMQSLIE